MGGTLRPGADGYFDLQDEITADIVTAIGPEVTLAEIDRVRPKRPENLDAWDQYLRALPLMHQIMEKTNAEAKKNFQMANELDPNFVAPHAGLAWCHALDAYFGWSESGSRSRAEALKSARKAVELDPDDPFGNVCISWVYLYSGQQRQAIDAARRALELDPNSSQAYGCLGNSLALAGRPDEAIEASKRALRGSPRDPFRSHFLQAISNAYFMQGSYEDAIEWATRASQIRQSYFGSYLMLAASAAYFGRVEEARSAARAILRFVQRFTLRGVEKDPMFTQPEDIKRLVDGLREAGLPE